MTGWVDSPPPVGVTGNTFRLYRMPSLGFAIRFRMEGTLQGNTGCMGAYGIGNLRTRLTPSDTHTYVQAFISTCKILSKQNVYFTIVAKEQKTQS